MIESLYQFDASLFLKIHRDLSNPFFDWIMPLLRNKFFWSPLYLFIVIYCLKVYKKNGWYIIAGVLTAFAVGDMIVSRVIKHLVGRTRPCNDTSLANDIIHRIPCGSGYSFPSAHATNHFAIAVFLILVFYKRWKPILPIGIGWAFSIAFAQVYVGVHYPLDVTCGALIGILVGWLTFKFFKLLHPQL